MNLASLSAAQQCAAADATAAVGSASSALQAVSRLSFGVGPLDEGINESRGDTKMWVLFFIKILFITGIPALIIWLWRGKFLGKNLVGTRLEIHRQQLGRSSKQLFTVWGIMVLSTADQIISWNPVSRDFYQFWRGFFVASDLFLVGFLIAATLPFVREMQKKRQSQSPKSARPYIS